ncbi:MAG: GGDEF domain-containing protein [Blastocatellia bacterium]
MTDWIEQLFRRETGALAARLGAVVQSGDLDAIFREVGLLRLCIVEAIREMPERAGSGEWDGLIEIQAQWNAALDRRLRDAMAVLIAQRDDAASRDGLTGLHNRAAFDARLRDEFARARRYRRPLSLVLMDVDGFKSVNDRHGHLAGDEALVQVARIIRSSLRSSDTVFRYGGDEFAAICPETPESAVAGVFGRLESRIRSWAAENLVAETIGISWGVASVPASVSLNGDVEVSKVCKVTDERELIRVADERLYLCKREHHRQLAARR